MTNDRSPAPQPPCTPAPATALTSSLIIVNYNGRQHLQRCLPSVLQAGPPSEVIVVDNASSDGSAEYVVTMFPQVRLIRNEANLGFGHGANLGAREARGHCLVFLNPDTVVEPGWLEALVAALQAHPEAGLVTSRVLLLADPARINTCGNEVHVSGLTLCRGLGQERSTLALPHEVGAVSGAAFAIRREGFQALGGFDESFFMYMEDTDLSWRARLAGQRCLCIPASNVRHDYALQVGPQKVFYQERNRYLMWLKALRWRTWLLLLPALLLAEVVTWGFVLLRDRAHWTNKLRTYPWIARHWRAIMDSRRRTQAQRRVRDRELLALTSYRLDYGQSGQGRTAQLASQVLDPLFWLLRRLALAVMVW